MSSGPVTRGTGGRAAFAGGRGAGVVTTGAAVTGIGVGTAGVRGAHAATPAENAAVESTRNDLLVFITSLCRLVDNLIAWSVPELFDGQVAFISSRRAHVV